MSNIKVTEYGEFSNAIGTIKAYQTKVGEAKTSTGEVKTTLGNESIFMGPIQENCIQVLSTIDADISEIDANFSTLTGYIMQTENNYKKGDSQASSEVTEASQAGVTTGTNIKSSVAIPDSVNQAGYTVTCYGPGGWYLSGKDQATRVAPGTKQAAVHDQWVADGARYKNGIAVMNVNGKDHYLIATAPTLGNVGDNVDVKLDNGQTISCVIADSKSTNDSNYTKYGHGRSDGSVNVLEFEVDRVKYNSSGNPTTAKWGLEWDSNSDVSRVDNYGTVI